MTQDPGLFTDSTGEGTVGGTDVRFSTLPVQGTVRQN